LICLLFFLRAKLPTFLQIGFPAVPALLPAVEEVVAFLAGNLEIHEAETFSREDRLLTFAADDLSPEFHGLLLPALVPAAARKRLLRDTSNHGAGVRL
jgi:hypothetical protein